MIRILLILFSFFPLFSFAQSWQLYPLNQTSYYLGHVDSGRGLVHVFRMDSARSYGDTIVHYNMWNEPVFGDVACLDYHDLWMNNWSGGVPERRIDSITYYDGWVRYDRAWVQNPMLIKLSSIIGEITEYKTITDSVRILCSDVSQLYVFGVIDSIKVFELFEYQAGILSANPYTSFTVSKTFGVLDHINLFHLSINTSSNEDSLKLISANNLQGEFGYKLPHFLDYFDDISAGDLRFWKYEQSDQWFSYSYYSRDSITNVMLTNDSVSFIYDKIGGPNEGLDKKETYYRDQFGNALESGPDRYWFDDSADKLQKNELYLKIDNSDTISYKWFSGYTDVDSLDCSLQYNYAFNDSKYYSSSMGFFKLSGGLDWEQHSERIVGWISGTDTIGEVDFNLSIEDNEPSKKLKIFPNPTLSVFHITGVSNGSKYEIYDIQGRIVLKGTLEAYKIGLERLRPNIYFLRIEDEVVKIVKTD